MTNLACIHTVSNIHQWSSYGYSGADLAVDLGGLRPHKQWSPLLSPRPPRGKEDEEEEEGRGTRKSARP